MKHLAQALRNVAIYFLGICGIAGLIFGSNFVWKIVTYFSKSKSTCNMFNLDKASKHGDSWKRMSLCFNLESYRCLFCHVNTIVGSARPGLPKQKNTFSFNCSLSQNYTENISLTEQFEHLQSYFTLIWYDF